MFLILRHLFSVPATVRPSGPRNIMLPANSNVCPHPNSLVTGLAENLRSITY